MLGLAGEQSYEPVGLKLTWTPNTEDDLAGYRIHRDADPDFEPGEGNLLATTCDPMLFDEGWTWDSGYCYKVAAVDVHGNVGEYSSLCLGQVTGDEPAPLPAATFLAQNFPNPFNPVTSIAFGLEDSGRVSLKIYDAAGRLVAVLVDGTRPAGRYTAAWNGKDRNGRPAASGIYFYRLTTGDFKRTRKMTLLR